jgi:hypothetical protein
MRDLFNPIVAEEKLNPTFKMISRWPGSEPGRLMANKVFQNFKDTDGNFIEQFQTTGFDSRVFELYLFAFFSNSGYDVIQKYNSPDFLIRKDDITVAVEATTVNPAYGKDKSDIETKISHDKIDEKHDHELPIKFGSPLFSKLKKQYWELEHCKNIPIVIAIEAFHEKNSLVYSDHGIVQYLYGLKDKHRRNKQGKLIIEYENIEEHRLGEKIIPSNFFDQPDTEYISAIIFSNSGTWPKFSRMGYQSGYHRGNIQMVRQGTCYKDDPNSVVPLSFQYDLDNPPIIETWEQGLVVMHNPNALFPLPRYFIECSAVHYIENNVIKTECLPFHPFGSTTLNALLEDVHQAVTTDLSPSFVNLLKCEFDKFEFIRKPGPYSVTEEKEWYADNNRDILGYVFRDRIDDDYGYIVLGKDENGLFGTIDVEVDICDRNDARTGLFAAMEKFVKSKKKVFRA